MASVQCYKAEEKTSCHQHPSLGRKVSEMTSSIFKGHGSHQSHGRTTESYSQTETYYTDHGVEKTQTQYCHSETQGRRPHHSLSRTSQTDGQHASGAMACQGKTKQRGEVKKRGLLQKIKESFSDDSSSSDSESDDENCGTRKN